jgi:hypothetical protein
VALESSSQFLASSVVSRTSASVVLSTVRMFGSSSVVSPLVLRKVVQDEPQVHLLSTIALLSKFSVFRFEGSAVGLDVCRFPATVPRQ